jgi:hypothetical protein
LARERQARGRSADYADYADFDSEKGILRGKIGDYLILILIIQHVVLVRPRPALFSGATKIIYSADR